MTDATRVTAIEAAAFESWPPAEVAHRDGWTLYASGGFSRRVNSAVPPPRPSGDLADPARWFAVRGLPFVVRVAPPVVEADPVLEAAGFTKEAVTDVMTLGPVRSSSSAAGVEVAPEPTAEWIDVEVSLQGVAETLRASWSGIIGRIERPAAFALARDGAGAGVAAGFAVRVDRLVGLFEINVAAGHRRRGIGSAITAALLDWGLTEGGDTAYLQVVSANEGAVALYRSVGFERAYRYWYRRAPGG